MPPGGLNISWGLNPMNVFFCVKDILDEDEERLILWRGKFSFVIMNKFPYNTGHIMVTPYKHVYLLDELNSDELKEMMLMLSQSVTILKKVFNPHGINIGLNIGEAAGAGIEEHLHFHLVPRWKGDHSFMALFFQRQM